MKKQYLKLRHLAKKAYFKFKKPRKLEFPEILSIELSTICNAQCKFCPHSQIKRAKIMSDVVFKKIIDGCIGQKELKLIKPFLYGEPFVTPKFFDKLKYIREKLPNVKIRIVTNGAAMIPEKIEVLVSEHLCDEIFFSLDTINPQTFLDFKGLNYEKTIENINYFINKNNQFEHKIKVVANFVATKENEGELSQFKNKWKGKVDDFHIGTEVGLKRRTDYLNEATNLYCRQIFFRLNFLTNGKATMCCADAFGEVIVGDIKDNTVKEIWNGYIFNSLRELHLQGKKKEIALCENCNEWT
ncbi:MAG: radical SAM protein [Candidatus Pacearchaeota archaeon]|jgi:MoaA/NifB/PqqE/SkfB family radical SAM enzyme